MPRHATQTSFEKGMKRTPESIEKQKQSIAKRVAEGTWTTQSNSFRIAVSGPNPKKGLPGKRNNTWKPVGTKVICNGYIKVKIDEPNIWMYEHRFVAEQTIGRKLAPGEVVHHLNGEKLDNRTDNLIVMTSQGHSALPKSQNGHPRCLICGYRHPVHI